MSSIRAGSPRSRRTRRAPPTRGIPHPDPLPSTRQAGFEHAAGDDHFPVYRRELTGETAADAWSGLIRASRPDEEDDDWPLPLPPTRDPDELFRLPPEKPKRPNPFGDD